jgi:putative ABC transport system permease protein
VLTITFADLRYRARQFLIAVIGVGLVLAMALVLTGLADGFHTEIERTVQGFGADAWVLPHASGGNITSGAVFPETQAALVRTEPGIGRADPLLIVAGQVAHLSHGATGSVILSGVVVGGLGDPPVAAGHPLSGPGQVVVDSELPSQIGSTMVLGGRPFVVVGTVTDRSMLGGTAMAYLSLQSVQDIALAGRPLISAVLTAGVPRRTPSGLVAYSNQEVTAATATLMAGAASSVHNTTVFCWVVAIVIVAAMLYVAALERRRDFAVLKALGSSSAALFASLMVESVMVALVASLLAEVVSNLLIPLFAMTIDISATAYATLPVVAVVVGILASLVAVRRVTSADPAAAFG